MVNDERCAQVSKRNETKRSVSWFQWVRFAPMDAQPCAHTLTHVNDRCPSRELTVTFWTDWCLSARSQINFVAVDRTQCGLSHDFNVNHKRRAPHQLPNKFRVADRRDQSVTHTERTKMKYDCAHDPSVHRSKNNCHPRVWQLRAATHLICCLHSCYRTILSTWFSCVFSYSPRMPCRFA